MNEEQEAGALLAKLREAANDCSQMPPALPGRPV